MLQQIKNESVKKGRKKVKKRLVNEIFRENKRRGFMRNQFVKHGFRLNKTTSAKQTLPQKNPLPSQYGAKQGSPTSFKGVCYMSIVTFSFLTHHHIV
jgi:hypothetical protein